LLSYDTHSREPKPGGWGGGSGRLPAPLARYLLTALGVPLRVYLGIARLIDVDRVVAVACYHATDIVRPGHGRLVGPEEVGHDVVAENLLHLAEDRLPRGLGGGVAVLDRGPFLVDQ